jgi:hypothetical protein
MGKIHNHPAKEKLEDQMDFKVKYAKVRKRRFPDRRTEDGGNKGIGRVFEGKHKQKR